MSQTLETELVPAADRASRRLMVVLHGLGDSREGYRWLPGALNLPWLNYLLVNAPDPYYGGYSWYDLAGDARPGVERSRRLLTALLEEQERAGFPSAQTVLFGFSQGGLMTLDVGFRFARPLAGLVGISGYVHQPEQLLEQLSAAAFQQHALVTHGTDDPIIPFAAVREQINLLKAAGLRIDWREFVKEHTIAGEPEIEVIRDFVRRRCP